MSWAAVAGAAVGGVMSNMGGSDSQTVQNSVPPEFSGLASQVAQRGSEIGNMPFNPYPYSQVADFNPYQFMGFDMGANQAMNGQLPGQAQDLMGQTLGGGFLNNNPYLNQAIDQTLGDVTNQFNTTVAPTMAAQAMKSGSFGNTGFQEMEQNSRNQLADRLGGISNNMRMGAYEAERGRQMGAMQMAPNINMMGYQPAEYLQGIGSTMQQQGQNELNSWYNQFQQAQEWPFKTFDAMMAPFGRNIGSQTTQTGPAGNPVSGMMGGAMMGNKFQGMFGGTSQPNSGFGMNNPSYNAMDWGTSQGYW
jgi:hypothetical protein